MSATRSPRSGLVKGEVALLDGEMVELSLLLPDWQVEVLASAASRQGRTTGQMLRHIIRDFCEREPLGAVFSTDEREPDDIWSRE